MRGSLWSEGFRCAVWVLLCFAMPGCPGVQQPGEPTGDVDRGRTLFGQGDGAHAACTSCHCPDASGGCRLGAPRIQGASFDLVRAKVLGDQIGHSGGKFDFTEQDVADIAAWLKLAGD